MLRLWKTKPTEVEVPAFSLSNHVAEAHAAWKLAEVKLNDACLALNRFCTTHPAHVPIKKIGDQIYIQLQPNDPELIRLSSAENRARFDRDTKLKTWCDLKLKFSTNEAVHVAGERV